MPNFQSFRAGLLIMTVQYLYTTSPPPGTHPIDGHREGGGLGRGGLHIPHCGVPRGSGENIHGSRGSSRPEAPTGCCGRGGRGPVPLGEAVHHCRGEVGREFWVSLVRSETEWNIASKIT